MRRFGRRQPVIRLVTQEDRDRADALIRENEERWNLEAEEKRTQEELWKSQEPQRKLEEEKVTKKLNELKEALLKHREETLNSPEFKKDIERAHALRHRNIYGKSKEKVLEHLEQFSKEYTEQYIKNDEKIFEYRWKLFFKFDLSIDEILSLGNDLIKLSSIVKQKEEEELNDPEKRYKMLKKIGSPHAEEVYAEMKAKQEDKLRIIRQENERHEVNEKMKGQKRWRFIASENDHFPYDPIPIGAELRYGSGDKWFYKNMTEDMKEKRNMTSHDALGVDHDVAPGVVKQLEIHEKYTGSKWVPITEPELILKARGRKTRRNRNLKKLRKTRKH